MKCICCYNAGSVWSIMNTKVLITTVLTPHISSGTTHYSTNWVIEHFNITQTGRGDKHLTDFSWRPQYQTITNLSPPPPPHSSPRKLYCRKILIYSKICDFRLALIYVNFWMLEYILLLQIRIRIRIILVLTILTIDTNLWPVTTNSLHLYF